jgi:high affinity Mn2+ porin
MRNLASVTPRAALLTLGTLLALASPLQAAVGPQREPTDRGPERQELLDRIALLEGQLTEARQPVAGETGPVEGTRQEDAEEQVDVEDLLNRIEILEERLGQLESTAVLSEPETRVRQIEVWVDDDGVEYDQEQPGTRRVITYQRERVYRRQTINEKIEEALDDAATNSVAVGVDAGIASQFAFQTQGTTAPPDRNAYELASADLYFTAGIAQYTIFFADIVALSGPPPDLEIGGLTLLNGYSARLVNQNELNLREAWLATELFSQNLGVTVGRVDLTNYFDHNAAANDETTQFISDALVNNPALGLSTNGAGGALVFDPKTGLNLKFGIQQSNSEATNLSEALYSLAEVSYLITPFRLGEGTYRFWYRTDNSEVDDRRDGLGVSFDQKLSRPVTLFGRFGSAEATTGRDYFYSGGLQFQGGGVFNPGDTWGIGYAHYDLATGEKERLTEGYYNLQLTERLGLSFHATHVVEKAAGAETVGYFVPGIRLQASF